MWTTHTSTTESAVKCLFLSSSETLHFHSKIHRIYRKNANVFSFYFRRFQNVQHSDHSSHRPIFHLTDQFNNQLNDCFHILSTHVCCISYCIAPCSDLYSQCGDIGYQGSTQCCFPASCQYNHPWYSQCLTGTTTTFPSTTTPIFGSTGA